MGKPGPLIYKAAASMLNLPAEEVLVVGDSLEHDIRGANENGMDSLLICSGILASDLNVSPFSPSTALNMEKLVQVAQEQDALPTYCMIRLSC